VAGGVSGPEGRGMTELFEAAYLIGFGLAGYFG
jgi:hypothetical protein